MDTVWSSTRTIYAKDRTKYTTATSNISLSVVTVQGAEALDEETATRDELPMRCTVTEGGTAVESTEESGIENAIGDDKPRNTVIC